MTTVMGYFDGLGVTAAAVQYDGTVYGTRRLQDWIEFGTYPPDFEQDDLRGMPAFARSRYVTASLFIFGNTYTIDPTDWLVNTVEGDWLIFKETR